MAFQFRADEHVADGIKRMARGQINKALDGLTGRTGADPEKVVHDVRKRFKKVRALLRLVRPDLGRKAYGREDARFRDAGRPLSEVRDAAVLVEALDRLAAHAGDRADPRALGAIREALRDRKRATCLRVLDEGDALAAIAGAVQESRRRVKGWEIGADDWPVLADGLDWIYRRGRRAFRDALDEPTDEALHEWRKRVKDLAYALDILEPIRPGFAEKLGCQADRLAEDLGDDHDLAVLHQLIADPAQGLGNRDAAAPILPLIDARRAELQEAARQQGRQLYRDRPRIFVDRLGAYWRAWRSEAEAAKFG